MKKRKAMAKATKARSTKTAASGTKTATSGKDDAWFERKVAELGAKLNRLPAARQEQLERELASQAPPKRRRSPL